MNTAIGTITGAVDVTRVHIPRPPVNKHQYFSAKDKFHALKYEIATSIQTNQQAILWIYGPIKGSVSDLKIFQQKLKKEMGKNEKMIADKGYIGEDKLLTASKEIKHSLKNKQQTDFETNLNSIRQDIERVNKRIKIFNAMGGKYRGDFDMHKVCAEVIVKMLNIIFKKHPL